MACWEDHRWRWVAVCTVAVCLGCTRAEEPGKKSGGPGAAADKRPAVTVPDDAAKEDEAARKGKQDRPPPPATIPQVKMAETDRATCLVRDGNPMPDAELPDLEGKKQSLRALFGKKLTVVVLWTSKSVYALQELEDLETDVPKPYRDKGVQVIGINERDTPQVARENFQRTGATFPTLLDSDGAYFAKLATERLPRTYLLDAGGKILWFDIEYSRSTRRGLEQGIKVALGELK